MNAYHFISVWIVLKTEGYEIVYDTYETQTNRTNIYLVVIRAKWLMWISLGDIPFDIIYIFTKDAYHLKMVYQTGIVVIPIA